MSAKEVSSMYPNRPSEFLNKVNLAEEIKGVEINEDEKGKLIEFEGALYERLDAIKKLKQVLILFIQKHLLMQKGQKFLLKFI